jgi:exopolysaccharide biosynthesis polyprenyl glycosylphosphotransferase
VAIDAAQTLHERRTWAESPPRIAARECSPRTRGWLVRRMLLAADVAGLVVAFLAARLLSGAGMTADPVALALFLLTLPGWVVAAKLYGLYDRDEELNDHSTLDEGVAVLHLVTVGTWLVVAGASLVGARAPALTTATAFWLLAVAALVIARAVARCLCRQSVHYLQNTVIVGAGTVGQLVARKFLQHPEYGINVVGFVDARPRERRADLGHLALLGELANLRSIVTTFDVERVVLAFSDASHEETLEVVRSLRDLDVQIDLVPRLFELVGPRVNVHTVECLALIGLPPVKFAPSSLLLKRGLDVTGALIGLALAAPLLAVIALLVKLDSPGPALFRQTRLGMGRRPFTTLKFRTMLETTGDAEHRAYIQSTMTTAAVAAGNGLYKLQREASVTRVGAWLRRTSLDELPQLVNVLLGQMSLVGPRPCLPYEVEHFEPHHHERFLVPAGLTGLWQVTARARATFGEALEMDVAYVHAWSLGLDLRLLLRTPLALLRPQATA